MGPGKVVVLTARGGTGQGSALQLGEAESGGHILHGRTGPADIAEVLRWLVRFAVCTGDGEPEAELRVRGRGAEPAGARREVLVNLSRGERPQWS